jgi:hypothetical protein
MSEAPIARVPTEGQGSLQAGRTGHGPTARRRPRPGANGGSGADPIIAWSPAGWPRSACACAAAVPR